ncbi:MAG: transporter substrate-binding domain-containing protein [Roseibium sp.]
MLNAVSRSALLIILGLMLSLVSAPAHAAERNSDYVVELVRKIMERTEAPGAAPMDFLGVEPFSRNRTLLELVSGQHMEFTALPTKPEWEEKLIPIRIPIKKGLQGYRLFFVNEQDRNLLADIETLDQLKKVPIGSGTQWSTTEALEEAGFNVVKGLTKDDLTKMLSLKRFQIYGRGIDEIFAERAQFSAQYPSMVIDEHIALFIPHPIYFFVTPKRPDLAERIERGLREMIADGSFDALFQQYHGDDIQRAGLDRRRIFRISNPLLGPETPLGDPSLWFDPARSGIMPPETTDPVR